MAKLTGEESVRIAELRDLGWSYGRIANKFNVSAGCVHYHCLKQGAFTPRTKGPRSVVHEQPVVRRNGTLQRRFTPEEDERMQELSRQGLSIIKIAERMGRAPTSVRIRLMRLALHEEMAA